jgi:hypothetical protein
MSRDIPQSARRVWLTLRGSRLAQTVQTKSSGSQMLGLCGPGGTVTASGRQFPHVRGAVSRDVRVNGQSAQQLCLKLVVGLVLWW